MAPLPAIPERAATGAALLDTHQPQWFQWLEPSKLDLGDPENCVLAQLHGTYKDGLDDLTQLTGDGDLDEGAYGFARHPDELPDRVYPELTAAWQVEITRRLAGGAV